jgi:hypothetical protein
MSSSSSMSMSPPPPQSPLFPFYKDAYLLPLNLSVPTTDRTRNCCHRRPFEMGNKEEGRPEMKSLAAPYALAGVQRHVEGGEAWTPVRSRGTWCRRTRRRRLPVVPISLSDVLGGDQGAAAAVAPAVADSAKKRGSHQTRSGCAEAGSVERCGSGARP